MNKKLYSFSIDSWVIIFLALGTIAIHPLVYLPGHNWGDDFCLYINQSKSILNNEVATLIARNEFSIKHSSIQNFTPTLAPWGFPIILTPFIYFFGVNIEVFKIIVLFFFVLFLCTFYKFSSSFSSRISSIFSTIFIGTNFHLLTWTNNVLTEIPFLFLSTVTLKLIGTYKRNPFYTWHSFVLGFFLFFALNVRTEGAFLFIALLTFQIRAFISANVHENKRVNFLYFTLPYAFAIFFILMTRIILPNGYLSHFNSVATVSFASIKEAISKYSEFYQHLFFYKTSIAVSIALSITFIIGVVIRLYRDIHIVTYVILLMGILITWPFVEFRYVYASFPFIVYFSVHGLEYILKVAGCKSTKYVFTLLLVFILYINIPILTTFEAIKESPEGPDSIETKEMLEYINNYTATNDTVLFFRPRLITLYTGRRSAMVFRSWREIASSGNYFIFYKHTNVPGQIPAGFDYQPHDVKKSFAKSFENRLFIVYEIRKDYD